MLNHPGRRVSSRSLAPQPYATNLNLLCGGAPALLVDRHGIISAANTKAASILNRTVSELIGQPFGHWVSSLECADLDVVRYSDGKLSTRIVHARRLDHLADGETTVVTLSETVTVANTPLPEVMADALARVHAAHPTLRHAITVTRIPNVAVSAEAGDAIATWIRFLFHLAGAHRATLTIRGSLRHGGWAGFDLFLLQSTEPISPRHAVPRPTDERLLDVRRLGGDFRLLIDDPRIQLDLWIPHELDAVPSV